MTTRGQLVRIITSADPAVRDRSLDAFAREAIARAAARRVRRPRGVAPRQRQPLRASASALLPLRAPPLPPPGEAGEQRLQAHGRQPDPVRRATLTCSSAGSRRRSSSFLRRPAERRPERRDLERARRGLPPARLPDAGRPGAAERPLGARQPVDVPDRPPDGPAAAGPPRAARARRRRALPDPARGDAGPHGPQPQRLERHLLPRDGLPRGRARPQHLDRPGRARPRPEPAAADRGVLPRDRRAGAAAGQRRPRRDGRR